MTAELLKTQCSMYFHRCVMDLFRPYIMREKTQQCRARHTDFDAPEAIFRASTQRKQNLPDTKVDSLTIQNSRAY